MEPEMISSLHINTAEPNVTTNDNYERPLMSNASSQTTSDEFLYLNATNQTDHLKREKELEKEVEELRKCKRELLGLLSQLHGTIAHYYNKEVLGEEQQLQHQLPSSALYYNEILLNSEAATLNPSQYPGVICETPQQINQNLASNQTSYITIPNLLIYPQQLMSSANNENVIYTVADDANADHNGEPTEIQLTKEDGALNLNSSTDSGRLEICWETKHNLEVESEQPVSAPSEHNVLKRRKLYTKKQRRRLRDGLLTTSKIENTNDSSHTQATPKQALMPSPNNGISSQCEAASTSHSYYVDEMVSLGPYGTEIPASLYTTMSFDTASIATITLLETLFDLHTLATHSISPENGLQPDVIFDIAYAVSIRCDVGIAEVCDVIITKCWEEDEILQTQTSKLSKNVTKHKENNE